MLACLVAAVVALPGGPSLAQRGPVETLPQALVRTYQGNPQLNAERARLRGTDEGVPQALAGYRPQIVASLSGGLQAVRVLLPDNTIQTATLKSWTIGLTVTQTIFNGFKTANTVRQSESQVMSGREALRNTGQGVLLDAVTAYTNVLANQSLVEAQRINVTFLRETLASTKRRLDAGDVTPTDVAQSEARLSRGLADLNAAEVALAVSQATYTEVIGAPPGRLVPPDSIDRLLPRTRDDAIAISRKEHPAIMAAMYDTDVAQYGIKIAESGLWPNVSVQAGVQRTRNTDTTLSTQGVDQATILGQANIPIYDGGLAASQVRQAKELAMQARIVMEQIRNQSRTAAVAAWATFEGSKIALAATDAEVRAATIALAGRAEGSGRRPAHHARRAQLPAGPDGGARPPDRGAARPRDRRLYAAQRHRPPRRQDARAQHARLCAGDALPPGARRLARAAHPERAVTECPAVRNNAGSLSRG